MKVDLLTTSTDFRPWRPADGRVLGPRFAFDCETARIDEYRPWLLPPYVLGAGFDGQRGVFVARDCLSAFMAAHRDATVVMHHAPFDLGVIDLVVSRSLDIYRLVDEDRVYDTQLLHRLYTLGTEGHTASWKGQSTLEHCVQHYLGCELPKDVVDSAGNLVRLSYGRWLDRPPREIEPVYLEYLARDVLATYLLFDELTARIDELLKASRDVWGYVTDAWLQEQGQRWGPQTHHIQLKAAIVLDQITDHGIGIDLTRRDTLQRQLAAVADEKREAVRRYGYLPGEKGSDKALQEILNRLEREHPELEFSRTPGGKYATTKEALSALADHEFIRCLLEYRGVQKLQSTFLDKMGRQRLHPSFDVLKTTGRTSSFGEINAQNLPRDDRVRSCFCPASGHVYLNADYSTIELATLGQSVQSQFGLTSQMVAEINTGTDLHRLVAARTLGKPETQVTGPERQKAKPINFGKPGAMGNATLKMTARTNYAVALSDEEVQALSDAWFALFPEMQEFLKSDDRLASDVAASFDFTPMTYFEHTGSRRFLDHPENAGKANRPHAILGAMCLKVLKTPKPTTSQGRPYSPEELDYFWAKVEENLTILPRAVHSQVRGRRAGPVVQRAVMRAVGQAGVFTLTGRLRAQASFAARHNTVFQGLAADGAKLGLWLLWRAGYPIVNFVHDEVLIELSERANLALHAEIIRHLMIEGMQAVVPDVRIEVKYAVSDRWYKEADLVLDEKGQLKAWSITS